VKIGDPWGFHGRLLCRATNIEHYRAMLKRTTDPERRRLIEQLLLDEEAKLKKYDEDHRKQNPALGRGDNSGPGSQE